MEPRDVRTAINSLEAVLAQIDAGELEATDAQRAYITGSLDTLRQLIS